MTRSELIRYIYERFPALATADAEAAVDLILEKMAEHLTAGDRIDIRGFGSFVLNGHSSSIRSNRRKSDAVDTAGLHAANTEAETTIGPATTKPKKYTLDELLAQCDPGNPSPRISGWDDMTPVGKEIL